MDRSLVEVEKKASILISALPYIRDFNQKVVVIEYGCSEWLNGVQEQKLMQDIALLKSIGMKPVVVHSTRMGVDKFRENKRIAKLVEFCGEKAIGICGIDEQTLHMTIDNGYIPVIVPNDIDSEMEVIDPQATALDIAIRLGANKLVFLTQYGGLPKEDGSGEFFPRLSIPEMEKLLEERELEADFRKEIDYGFVAVNNGVDRVHFLDGRQEHVLLIEFFSVRGAGTILIQDEKTLYKHELKMD